MPSACLATDSGAYVAHHNALAYLTNNPTTGSNCAADDVPFTQFQTDLNNDTAPGHPSFYDVIPDQNHNAHGGWFPTDNTFLSSTLAAIIASPLYQQHHAAIVVTADEGDVTIPGSQWSVGEDCVASSADPSCNVPFLVVAPNEHGRNVTALLSAYSILRSMENAAGVPLLGGANQATGFLGKFGLSDGVN